MRKSNVIKKTAFLASCATLLLLASCRDEERLTAGDTTDLVTESLTDSYFEDMDDMSLTATESSPANGRIQADDRFCEGTVSVGEGSTQTSGTVVINFGTTTGCTDSHGNLRKGVITLTYSNGPVGSDNFKIIAVPTNYTINGVKLEGTRTIQRVSSQTSVKHNITLENGKATWPDASFATRSSSFVREITNDAVYLSGSAEGTNRRNKSYTMNIEETLEYNITCAASEGILMAVDGRKSYKSNGRQLVIDYGDGTCDRNITIQVGDVSRAVNVEE